MIVAGHARRRRKYDGPPPSKREQVLTGIFFACWFAALVSILAYALVNTPLK